MSLIDYEFYSVSYLALKYFKKKQNISIILITSIISDLDKGTKIKTTHILFWNVTASKPLRKNVCTVKFHQGELYIKRDSDQIG